MTEQEQQDTWEELGIRTDIPHPARVYDYILGGKGNFAADRETAERSLELVPEMLDSSRGNRQFLVPRSDSCAMRGSASSSISVPGCPPARTRTRLRRKDTRTPASSTSTTIRWSSCTPRP